MKILIVDDETLARERLCELIMELDPGISFSQAENGLQALEKIQKEQPDIVLLDIRMPVMDGLETAQHITYLASSPAIIFTTAYQEHALDAFEANAVDYLLKPIRKQRLQTALQRASVLNRARVSELRGAGASIRTHLSAIVHGNIQLLPVEKIRYLKADQKYVTAAWPEGELLLDESLKSLETEFSVQFLRIHRNALISRQHIEGLEKDVAGSYYVRLQDMQTTLTVSRRHLGEVKTVIKRLAG
ncbi:MAG: LytTR family DNA-binding domain-containing protein [Gammaproteobacteria bacterium]